MIRADLLRLRLATHALARARFRTPEEVVAWFGAVQAQDYLGSLWAIGQRMRAATEAKVEAAETRRAIVRLWPMRGTLHFVAAADVRWMTQLLAPRVIARNAARIAREVGVDSRIVARSRDVVTRTLAGGRRLERTALYEALEARRIGTGSSRGLHILGWLAQEGTICLAGREGKQHTFALLDEWIPKAAALEREAALAELATRYFTSHGPATLRDLMWWAGLTAADAQAAIDGAKHSLAREMLDGVAFWRGAPSARRRSDTGHRGTSVSLLPAFDEYTVAYHERALLADTAASKMALLSPAILVDGKVAGHWARKLGKREVTVMARLHRKLTRTESAALQEAARSYGSFVGLETRLLVKTSGR
jgi:hypothetical protein